MSVVVRWRVRVTFDNADVRWLVEPGAPVSTWSGEALGAREFDAEPAAEAVAAELARRDDVAEAIVEGHEIVVGDDGQEPFAVDGAGEIERR